MSRIGRKPIPMPSGVTVTVDEDYVVRVKGKKGELSQKIDPIIEIAVEKTEVKVTRKDDTRRSRALHGLYRNLLANMIIGVSEGWERKLEVIGTGYKAEQSGKALLIALGYSHQILFVPPTGIELAAEPITKKVNADGVPNQFLTARISVKGIDRHLVGQVAARIRGLRSPDPYKSKGIRYAEERIRLKVGKSGK